MSRGTLIKTSEREGVYYVDDKEFKIAIRDPNNPTDTRPKTWNYALEKVRLRLNPVLKANAYAQSLIRFKRRTADPAVRKKMLAALRQRYEKKTPEERAAKENREVQAKKKKER